MDKLSKEKALTNLGGYRKSFFVDNNGYTITISPKLQVALQHLNAKEVRCG